MASRPVKLKLLPRSVMKAKSLMRLPTQILGATGILVTRSAGTWTVAVDPANLPAAAGLVIGVDVQAYDSDLQALASNSTNGLLARTGTGTVSSRTLTAPAAGMTVTNGDGVSGNPTLVLANDLAALEGLASTGFSARIAADTWAQRTLTGTASRLTVTNGDGVSTDPTFDISTSYVGQATITTLGTITTGVWTGTDVAFANIAQGTARSVLGVTGNATADLASIQGAAGTMLGVPNAGTSLAFTATPQLGISGTLGSLTFGNATSGLITLQPVAGALGTPTVLIPAASDTLVGKATTDVFTNKSISGSTNTLSAIALSSHATQAAWTFVVNNTSGAAAPTAVDIASFTLKASPAATDLILLSDQAASGAIKRATVSSVASAGSVSSIAGNTGAFTLGIGLTNATNDIRVSLTTTEAFLGGNTGLNNSTFTDGPAVAQGTTGVFLCEATATLSDTASCAFVLLRIWDGTTTYGSTVTGAIAANGNANGSLSCIVTNPAGNLRLAAKSATNTSSFRFNDTGLSKDTSIRCIRIG